MPIGRALVQAVTTNGTAVQLDGVVVVLGGYPALAGASVAVRAGELVALRGANGSGKSTLLRACAGLVPVARGTVRVLGVHDDRTALRRHVGLLGHKNGLYADLTARENVQFTAQLVGAGATDVDDALRRLGIDARVAATRAGSLSAGQRRRAALASLVVRRARVWLLDEPHAGLDAASRDELDSILAAATRAGATVIFTTHEIEPRGTAVPRTVTLAGGVVVSDEPAAASTGGAR
jgi:heme ABC exporter ATP-binding subunit CcmA